MSLGSRLRAARKEKGYTQKELAKLIGAKHNSVSNWENDQNRPDHATLGKLCGLLGITPNMLLMGSESPLVPAGHTEVYSAAERDLISGYRLLDSRGQSVVASLVRYMSGEHLQHKADNVSLLPVETPCEPPRLEVLSGRISTQPVSAGTGVYLDEDAFEEIFVQSNPATRRADFFVPVSGDSMEPRFHDGDILMVEAAPVRQGEIGVFTLDNTGYVKVLGQAELISLNPAYDPIPMDDSIFCNGKVSGVLSSDWIVR